MGARELLAELAQIGVHITADGGNLLIRPASRLSDSLRAELRAAKPALLALLEFSPESPQTAEGRKPQPGATHPAPSAEQPQEAAPAIPAGATRTARRLRLMRWGWPEAEAERLAARLERRDSEQDDRRFCFECLNLSGHQASGWRCSSSKRASVSSVLPPALVQMPQRCPSFSSHA